MLRIQNHFQIAINVATKALEMPDLMKDRCGDDKDVLDGHYDYLKIMPLL